MRCLQHSFSLAFRALRAFRSVVYIKSLRVIVTALLKSMIGSVLDLLLLLLLFIFLFGVMGLYLFTTSDGSGDQENWGSLGKAFFSLFVYTTVTNYIFGLC
jgi:cation channel sperm-associated protein 3